MKLILVLLTSLFSQDSFLVKQGDVEVPLSDLDAYVYLLQQDKRGGFASHTQQIEKNIFTLLNMNIVYQHIVDSDLDELDAFKKVASDVNDADWVFEESFTDLLDVEKDQMINSVKSYTIKREYYKAMLAHLNEITTEDSLQNSAREYYLVNKKKFLVPEKRDLSVILLDSTENLDTDSLLKDLTAGTLESFQEKAVELSSDPSKQSNEGNWGEFKRSNFNYSFKNKVFAAEVGVIPEVLEDRGKSFIIRVNGITPQNQSSYEDVKADILKQLKEKAVVRKFQSIINEKAKNEIEVNPELVAHVFERYKVFIQE